MRSISHQGLLLNRDGLALVGDPGVGSVDLNNVVRVPVDGALALEERVRLNLDGLHLVLLKLDLLTIDLTGPVLDNVPVSLGGSQLNLGPALKDGNMLQAIDLLGEDSVFLVLGAVRGDQVVTLINLIVVGLLVKAIDISLSKHALSIQGSSSEGLVALLQGVLA